MQLTATTARADYAKYLAETARPGSVVEKHALKVAAMTEEQWVEHRAHRIAESARFQASGAASRMVAEIRR